MSGLGWHLSRNVCILSVGTIPQTAFAGQQKSLQYEWQFIQRVIDDIGDCLFDAEAAITDIFLLAL
jgi:hypothetical protein